MDPKHAKGKHLFETYNKRALATGVRLQGQHLLNRVEEFDELDPEWTDQWLGWIYDNLYNRNVLDHKTRVLVILGEATCLGAERQIPNHIRSAMRMGATPRECLEVILQASTYVGFPRMISAMKLFRGLMREIGEMDLSDPVFQGDAREGEIPDWLADLTAEVDQSPTKAGRISPGERKVGLSIEERRADLLSRHDRKGVETGVRLQGEFFMRQFDELDELDESWTDNWLRFIYGYLYNRNVLDERTRLLVVIGECTAVDEQVQLPNHIRSALGAGAKPEEILEVILQASIYAGMPRMIKAARVYRSLMRDLGIRDFDESPFRGDARH